LCLFLHLKYYNTTSFRSTASLCQNVSTCYFTLKQNRSKLRLQELTQSCTLISNKTMSTVNRFSLKKPAPLLLALCKIRYREKYFVCN
jgi:hypothetical protein